jgi:hypothetical protein
MREFTCAIKKMHSQSPENPERGIFLLLYSQNTPFSAHLQPFISKIKLRHDFFPALFGLYE